MPRKPLIGITTDLAEPDRKPGAAPRIQSSMNYARAIAAAGGTPLLLPPIAELAEAHAAACDGFVLTGGADPRMEPLGGVTHPQAEPMHPQRQAYEFALLKAIDAYRDKPALGVCLGMQLMALHNGGTLDQHLPDSLPHAERHRKDFAHPIKPTHAAFPFGPITGSCATSNHHQAVNDPGRMRVLATSDDGVIEAVDDPGKPFYIGVQWHPERTSDPQLGAKVFEQLITAATKRANA